MGNNTSCCCIKSSPIEKGTEEERVKIAKQQGRRPSISAECLDTADGHEYVKKVIKKDAKAYQRIHEAVEHNFMFTSLDEEERQELFDAMEEKKVKEGEIIIKEGDKGDYFYIVDQGEYEVFKAGKNDPVHHYYPGGSFGELALMYSCPRAATVIAKKDGILWMLDRDTFRHIIVKANKRKVELYESLLSKMEFLQNLTSAERSTIADALVPSQHKDGEIIIRQNDDNYESFRFYIIVEGECTFTYNDPTTNQVTTLGSVKVGEYFGEKALTEKSQRAVNVIAKGFVKCLSLDVITFERLMGPCQEIFNRKIKGYQNTELIGNGNKVETRDASAYAPTALNNETSQS